MEKEKEIKRETGQEEQRRVQANREEERRAQEEREKQRRAEEAREEQKSAQEAREEQRRAQEALEQRRAQEEQESEAKAQEEQEGEGSGRGEKGRQRAQEEQKKEVSSQSERESQAREGKDMTTQEIGVEAKKEANLSNRQMTRWRNAWWVRMDNGPHLRTARGSRRVWRAATRAAQETRKGKKIGDRPDSAVKTLCILSYTCTILAKKGQTFTTHAGNHPGFFNSGLRGEAAKQCHQRSLCSDRGGMEVCSSTSLL